MCGSLKLFSGAFFARGMMKVLINCCGIISFHFSSGITRWMIEQVLSNPPFKEIGNMLWQMSFFAILWGI